jgi:hypothetical protein
LGQGILEIYRVDDTHGDTPEKLPTDRGSQARSQVKNRSHGSRRLKTSARGSNERSPPGDPIRNTSNSQNSQTTAQAGLLGSFSAVNPHRNGDKSGEILNQNCGALGLNYSLCCPITKQSANCALGCACHLGQVLARQVDPRASGRTLPLQDETQQNFCEPLWNTVGGKFMNPAL